MRYGDHINKKRGIDKDMTIRDLAVVVFTHLNLLKLEYEWFKKKFPK